MSFPIAPLKRIIKGTTGIRITKDAGLLLNEYCDQWVSHYGKKSYRYAFADKRKTIQPEDVRVSIPYIYPGEFQEDLPLAPIRRALELDDIKLRVSKDALLLLRRGLQTRLLQVASEVYKIVKYSKRKTIDEHALSISFQNTQKEMRTGIQCETEEARENVHKKGKSIDSSIKKKAQPGNSMLYKREGREYEIEGNHPPSKRIHFDDEFGDPEDLRLTTRVPKPKPKRKRKKKDDSGPAKKKAPAKKRSKTDEEFEEMMTQFGSGMYF